MSDASADATSAELSNDTKHANEQATEQLGEAGEKALAAWKERAKKAEAEAKANRDKAARFDAIEESTKSDIQKASDLATQMKAERDEAVAGLLRYQVATDMGLPGDAVKLLTGSTLEEIGESAKTVASLLSVAAKGAASRPVAGLGKSDGNAPGTPEQQFIATLEANGF